MKKKLYGFLLLLFIICISLLIVVLPTFFTKDIGRVAMHQEINLPLLLNTKEDIQIVFFGYSGCVDICMPRISAINKIYSSLDAKTKKRVAVAFLDVSSPLNINLPSDFAKSFNEEFEGIYLDKSRVRGYTKEFNVHFSKSLMDDEEYNHTTNLYIIKKAEGKKKIRYIYSAFPYDLKQIQSDIKGLMDE